MKRKSKIVEILKKSFSLVVSLPVNDPEMAAAAQENGADALKVHINVDHFASGTGFKSWKEEKKNISRILEAVSIPVGLLPGGAKCATRDEVVEARDMGIDFIDAFAHYMPVYLWNIENLGFMLAVNRDYPGEQVKALEFAGMDVLEATVLPREEYGKDLNMRDLSLYYQLARATRKPLVVPTQKKIRPEETSMLKKVGASGIIIGAIVTGGTVESVALATGKFREAITFMD